MKYAVLDFETTGSESTDHIIQVGLVLIDEQEITGRYSTFVKTSLSIPTYITQLTGITDDDMKDAPDLDTVIAEMLPQLQDRILTGHNIHFDLSFLQRALDQCGYAPYDHLVLDTQTAVRICYPGLSSLQLSMICSSLEIEHERPHQADSDAEATAEIWLKCLKRLEDLPLLTLQRMSQLYERQSHQQEDDFYWIIQEISNKKELSTSIDLDSNQYFRQFAMNVSEWQEEEAVATDIKQLHALSFEQFYTDIKQALQQEYDDYEERASQDQMIQEVYEAFEDEKHLMIEAGTGTGKSLGYLIPSLFYGLQQQQKMIISTHTINLQEQIRQRDVPLLQRILPFPLRVSLLKGRNHYLCLRKFENKVNQQDFDYVKEDTLTAAQMLVWLGETKHGDEEELYMGDRGNQFWQTVASDTDSCLNRACPWFKRCFYHRARHESNIADAVITNHSMLFTDVKAEHRLLPPYEHLIIDEAHHFEEVANKHLGKDTQYYSFVNSLHWLMKDSNNGLLPALQSKLMHIKEDQAKDWSIELEELYPKLLKVKEEWDQLSDLLYQLLIQKSSNSAVDAGQVLRLKQSELPQDWTKLVQIEENINIELSACIKTIDRLSNEIKEEQDEFDLQSLITDVNGAAKELIQHRDALHFFMAMKDEGYVYWIEANPTYKNKSLQLLAVPVDVSSMLRQTFFDQKESIVLTSATLSVDRSFAYSSEQLGLKPALESGKLKTVQLESPFDYREQALVCIPRDFPSIKGPSGDALFVERLVESLRGVAIEMNGGMLVLFTSYRMLKQVHERLKEELAASAISVLGQGIDSSNRSKLTRMFQSSSASVLLGTSSFWEGVDIPGEALRCLAIVRLPFQPPNHPLAEAKSDLLKQQNQNPFMKLSVPHAVIRFKQGFGRLIRKKTDRGVVIIFDTRVIDTRYGKYFLYSLPGPKMEHMPLSGMIQRISNWLEGVHDE